MQQTSREHRTPGPDSPLRHRKFAEASAPALDGARSPGSGSELLHRNTAEACRKSASTAQFFDVTRLESLLQNPFRQADE